MRVKQWNKLYKKAKKNKVSEWSVWIEVDDNNVPIVVRESGFIDHKHRTTKKYVRKGVNIGKSNEKTPLENATAIAERFFVEHIEDNWVSDFNVLNDPPKYLKPMLAKPFKRISRYRNMVVQPKYNGIRAVSFLHIGDKRLISRERNEFEAMNHISTIIPDMFNKKRVIYVQGTYVTTAVVDDADTSEDSALISTKTNKLLGTSVTHILF